MTLVLTRCLFLVDMEKSNEATTTELQANKFEQLLNSSKELVAAIKLTELNQIETISAQVGAKAASKVIKPYTESQLTALYHNNELEYLDDFATHFVEAELKGQYYLNFYLSSCLLQILLCDLLKSLHNNYQDDTLSVYKLFLLFLLCLLILNGTKMSNSVLIDCQMVLSINSI